MSVLDKIIGAPFICKIYLDFTGDAVPIHSLINQKFANTKGANFDWKSMYFSKQRVSFSEKERQTRAGSEYSQQLKIVFANSDKSRTDRIEKIKETKFLCIDLSNGQQIFMGRNDFYQNKPMDIFQSSDEKKTIVNFKSKSIFPVGFFETNDVYASLDYLIPKEAPYNLKSN